MVTRAAGSRLAVIGAGAWGTTLANLLAGKGEPVNLWVYEPDLAARMEQMAETVRQYGLAVAALSDTAINDLERQRIADIEAEMREAFGPLTVSEKAKRVAVHVLAALWRVRLRLVGDGIQPKTIVTHFPVAVRSDLKLRVQEQLRNLDNPASESLTMDDRKVAMVRHS